MNCGCSSLTYRRFLANINNVTLGLQRRRYGTVALGRIVGDAFRIILKLVALLALIAAMPPHVAAQAPATAINIPGTKYHCGISEQGNKLLAGTRLKVEKFDKIIGKYQKKLRTAQKKLNRLLAKPKDSTHYRAKLENAQRQLEAVEIPLIEIAKCRNSSLPYIAPLCAGTADCANTDIITESDFWLAPQISQYGPEVAARLIGKTCASVLTPSVKINGPYHGTVGNPIDFTAAAIMPARVPLIGYYWQFGDGSSSGWLQSPAIQHTYSQPGAFTTKLWVMDSCFRISFPAASTAVTISDIDLCANNSSPTATITGPTNGITGQPLLFSAALSHDADGTVTSYRWDFDDGSTASGSSATHAFLVEGIHSVTLTVTDNCGAVTTSNATVSVTPPDPCSGNHAPNVQLSGPQAGSTGLGLMFTAVGSSDPDGTITSITWNFGDGTSASGTTVMHSYSSTGAYLLHLTVTDNCGAPAYASLPVTISEPPPALCADATLLNFGSALSTLQFNIWNCGGGTLSYQISGNAPWLTVVPASGTSTGEHDTITALANRNLLTSGDYSAVLTLTGSGSPKTISVNVTVPPPAQLPMSAASRITGVAPLSVFFDGMDPASGIVQPPGSDYALYHYRWTFGDPASGFWDRSTGNPRNEAVGPLAGHVFDTPGHYVASLVVTDNSGQQYRYQQNIDVSDPSVANGWTTYYVSNSGNDSNNGTSETTAFKTFAKAASKVGAKIRILFRRGDSWQVSNQMNLNSGPGIIGAYGNAAQLPAPFLYTTAYIPIFKLSGTDWRILDLSLNGPAYNPAGNTDYGAPQAIGIDGGSATNRFILVKGVTMEGFHNGFLNTFYPQPIQHDHTFLVDNEISHTGNKAVYIGGARSVVLGNHFHDTGSHILRVWHGIKFVIAENHLLDPLSDDAAVIKFHNEIAVAGLPDGRNNLISGNKIKGRVYDLTIGTQGAWAVETVRDSIIERNTFLGSASLSQACRINARNITARNNIGDLSGAQVSNASLFSVEKWCDSATCATFPAPTGVRIYNNVVYRSTSGPGQLAQAKWGDTEFANNIVYSPLGGVSLGAAPAAHNLTTNPQWSSPATGDFSISASSPARNSGVNGPVLDDFFGNLRATPPGIYSEGALDMGCSEFKP